VRRVDAGGGVAILELDNPPANAMSAVMLERLGAALAEVEADLAVRAIILTGAGKAFCAGADLKAADADAAERGEEGGEDLSAFGRVLEQLAACRAPVIAAINGHCVGGGFEMALCCDLRIASSAARFVCAGVNMGLTASAYRLPRLIGLARAKAMLLTGLPHDAQTALAWGLVTAVHAPDELMAAARALAARLASRAPLSVEATKRLADRALDQSPQDAARALAAEMPLLRASADHREAVRAFVERREPRFSRL